MIKLTNTQARWLKLAATILFALVISTGCSFNEYDQGAGLRANWPERAEVGKAKEEPHGAHVRYEFDAESGNVTSIDVNITNATDVALVDESLIKSRSAASKTAIGAAGSRKGMLDNNTQVEGKAETASELAAALRELKGIVRDLKAPVTIPTTD
jgi:hypothetical protein